MSPDPAGTPPRATYRLQLTEDQPFAHAAGLVDYLSDMGVSHLYLSPVLAARPGTRHFYDVADHSRIDPLLGGMEGLRDLADTAHQAGMGLIGDLVPNHMGVGPWNPQWEAMLRDGRSSEAAKFFDVDWETPLPGASDKVILPVLHGPYGEELAAGRIGLAEGPAGIRITYDELSFPLNTETVAAVERSGTDRLLGKPGDERSWTRMHSLLEQQHYRLVSWPAGRRLVNYRRFLHIDALVALRVEDPQVFAATHGLMLDLVTNGIFDGLRIDHLDGLADPVGYLDRLREGVGPDAWIVVEKLTTPSHPLPKDWPVDGSTGYELLRTSLGLQVDPHGLRHLQRVAAAHGAPPSPRDLWHYKHDMLDTLGPDLRRLVRVIWNACQDQTDVRDVDYRTLLDAITRVLVAMDVYRTYTDPDTGQTHQPDQDAVERAVRLAQEDTDGRVIPDVVWRYLQALLTGKVRWTAAAAEAVTRFQQLSGPVMSLGVEHRLFLRYNAFVAACELGVDPFDIPVSIAEAHNAIIGMPPAGMRVTATHDTQHGEDVRLRMAALSGLANDWGAVADQILTATNPPDTSLGLRLLQVAVGIWPVTDDGTEPLAEVLDASELVHRFETYAINAALGQAVITSYLARDRQAEAEMMSWTRAVFDPEGGVAPLLRPVAVRAAEVAMAASLSQTVFRATVSGVPDTYQGTERWDDSLTDPDNRRPVDFSGPIAAAAQWAADAPDVAALWQARRDGRIKQWVLRQALRARADYPDVFGSEAGHEGIWVEGRWAAHLFGYRRFSSSGQALVVCPRVYGRVTDGGRFPAVGRIWADTEVQLPALDDGQSWHNPLTGATIEATTAIPAADLLVDLPVAVLLAR